jgi:hypothetical protein
MGKARRWARRAGITLAAVSTLVAGCAKEPPPPLVGKTLSLEYRFPPRQSLDWTEYVSVDGVATLRLSVHQDWAVVPGVPSTHMIVEEQDDGVKKRVRARYRVGYTPAGFGYLATELRDGSLEPWEPVEIVLPFDAHVGETWAAEHRKGQRRFRRECEIRGSERCDGGLVSVCDLRDENVRTVMREHFCPGVGWSGYESLHYEEGHVERRWSEFAATP